MNDFSTETAVCIRTLRYSVLTGVANAFYAPMIHIINCSEVLKNQSQFKSRSSYIPFRYVIMFRRNFFVLRDMYCCYRFKSGKYLPCNSNMADGQMVPISLP